MSGNRSLTAAGITDPALVQAYQKCRQLNKEHGRTYYLSTALLPPEKRPHVWALYGFARTADEFVDSLTAPDPDQLTVWGRNFLDSLNGIAADPSSPTDPVALAMAHTMRTWNIPRAHIEAFFDSMRMDISVTEYPTYASLEQYMYGSAAVIGLQMLPVLEPLTPEAPARARALGEAFQLTNFIRDVGEDLQRGRIYLPMEDLEFFGVTREILLQGAVTPSVRELLKFEITRARALYDFAEPGISMLHLNVRDCVRTAFVLYQDILDEVEANGYQVLTRRASVPIRRRVAVAVPAWWHATSVRRSERQWQTA